jgi:hypothetical protein
MLQPPAVVVTIDTAHKVRDFDPKYFFGGGVDGRPEGDAERTFVAPNVKAMRSAGLPRLTYRLRTELGIEAWHWNPRGAWSDAAHARGYWTSSDALGTPIGASYGYRLPRRGTTYDQADNEGYSRLTDGDTATFWKSNPYLDRRYTGEPDSLHPQRAILDLGERRAVNAVRLQWGTPWAVRYVVERWEGDDSLPPDDLPDGEWKPFPLGTVAAGRGGDVTLRLADAALPTRWLRVTMLESAHTAPRGSRDARDSVGYALREIGAGTVDSLGRFADLVRHAPSHDQTTTWVTSTDPWHRAVDRDPDVEQPGVDRVYASGLTSGLPMLVPVGVLYDTPANGAALLRYLRRRRHAVTRVELGEEPDGQYVTPADYGALAIQTAAALRRVDSGVTLGGPSFQSVELDVRGWPDEPDSASWLAHARDYFVRRGRDRDLAFVSFEWYPFDEVCGPTEPELRSQPAMLRDVFERLGPGAKGLPWVITEFGYSAFSGPAEVQMGAALIDPDIVGAFLTLGGDQAYLYGYEPADLQPSPRCEAWGNNALFLQDRRGRVRDTTAVYHTMRMVTHDWAGPDGGVRAVYRAASDRRDTSGAIVSAYALRDAAGAWAILLVNKDSLHAVPVRLRFAADTNDRSTTVGRSLAGPVDVVQFSPDHYAWQEAGADGRPTRSLPPDRFTRDAADLVLPGYSVTIVRTR